MAVESVNLAVERDLEFIEQRKNQRFKVNTGLFVVPSANPTRLCQIVDLSIGGLSFYYFDNTDWKKKSSKADILFPDDGFCLNKLPIKQVSDVVIDDDQSSFNTLRRCGIKFGRMTPSQAYWLEYLISIQNHINTIHPGSGFSEGI